MIGNVKIARSRLCMIMEINPRMFIKFPRMVIYLEIHGSWFIKIKLNTRMVIYLHIHARLFFKEKYIILLKIHWRTFIRMKLKVGMVIQLEVSERFFRTEDKLFRYYMAMWHGSTVLIEVQGFL